MIWKWKFEEFKNKTLLADFHFDILVAPAEFEEQVTYGRNKTFRFIPSGLVVISVSQSKKL